MGGTSSSHTDRKTREERDLNRQQAVKAQVSALERVETAAVSQFGGGDQSKALIRASDLQDIFQITQTAREQLRREDKPFTKADLVAIVVRLYVLQGTVRSMDELAEKKRVLTGQTVGDLNALIRCLVYDFSSSAKLLSKGVPQFLTEGSDSSMRRLLP